MLFLSQYSFAFSTVVTEFTSLVQYRNPYVFTSGVSLFANSKISLIGIALDVPVAFLSGFSIDVRIPASTGADTETNTTGVSELRFTIACVGGVAIVHTKS